MTYDAVFEVPVYLRSLSVGDKFYFYRAGRIGKNCRCVFVIVGRSTESLRYKFVGPACRIHQHLRAAKEKDLRPLTIKPVYTSVKAVRIK